MRWYPFDKQTCFMNFAMEGNSGIFVDLVPGWVKYDGPLDLAQYYIRGTDIDESDNTVSITVALGRRLLSTILTTYVPTLLLNIISLSTNYFEVNVMIKSIIITMSYLGLQSSGQCQPYRHACPDNYVYWR